MRGREEKGGEGWGREMGGAGRGREGKGGPGEVQEEERIRKG